MQPTMDTVIKTMRSLLNTSKHGLLEKQLRRDYRDMEGCDIPYKPFGYTTLLDFLRASGEFDLYSTNDGMQIRARVSQNSQHIVELVGSQNRDRRKKNTKSTPFIPRFNSNANRKPTTVNGRPMSQQPQRRQQYFANTTNRNNANFGYNNNNNNRNNYTSNASQAMPSATTNMKQSYNENWDMDLNKLRQLAPIQQFLDRVKQVQAQNAINFIAQTQAQAQAQLLIQANISIANAKLAASATVPVPKPAVSVNERLNPNFQPNQNSCSQNSIPAQSKPILSVATSAPVADKQWQKKELQEEPSWDEETPGVIDLTKSPQRTHVAENTSNNDNWKHDLYDSNQPTPKPVTNVMLEPISAHKAPSSSQSTVQNATTVTQEKKISSSWLSYPKSANEPAKVSVSDRLKSNMTNDQQLANDVQSRLTIEPSKPPVEKQSDTVDFVMQQQQQHHTNPFHEMLTTAKKPTVEQKSPPKVANVKSDEQTSKQSLELYCQQKGYDAPIYECCRSRFKKFIGTVCVAGVKYSTEPLEYEDKLRAENAAAAKALENCKDFPTAHSSSEIIAQQIYDCIGDNGVFHKYLSNIFEQKYEESLPNGWQNIIKNRPEMFSIMEQAANLSIVFKNASYTHPKRLVAEVNTPATKSSAVVNRNEAQENPNVKNDENELPTMNLPWGASYWRVLITAAESSVDIWGRYLESADWDELDEALGYIEDQYMNDSTRPNPCSEHEINEGQFYLAVYKMPNVELGNRMTYHAYRVRVVQIDRAQKRAQCFYIDDGYTEWIDYQTYLYPMNQNLFQYSAQAIHFSLRNVEDLEANPIACEEIKRQLLGDKRFVASIQITQKQFEHQLEQYDTDTVIPVILYDTSTEEDRNVNKDILQKTLVQMEPPQLNSRKTNVVDVTHVCENGDVYVRLRDNKDMELIERVLNRITTSIDIQAYRVDPVQFMAKSIGRIKLYLIYDTADERFYRAVKIPTETNGVNPMCRCVDYGFEKPIPIEYIFNLERLSLALSGYPYQAILVQLNGIDSCEYTADSIQRMRELLMGENKPIYLDIVVRSEWPTVQLWKTNKDGIRHDLNVELQRTLKVLGEAESVENGHLELHPKPKIGILYEATVTTALNPSLFYVRVNTNDSIYNKMINSLWKDCENNNTILTKNQIKLNHLYAGRLRDGYWHRVKVQAFPRDGMVAVEKWDFGDIDHLSYDALRPLSDTYLNVHQMVFCASLHDLQPCRNAWDKDDCARFHELTIGKTFKVEIKHIRCGADGNYVAELVLIGPKNINISDVLVREHRAI